MKKTKLIAFAGIDGSGKSTQIFTIKSLLEEKGYKVKVQQHFSTTIGKKCKDILSISKDTYIRALAFALDEYSQKINNIEDDNYDIILCDRSHYCAYAYLYAQGVDLNWIQSLYKYSLNYDLCIYLDITVETSIKRKGFDHISPEISIKQYNNVRNIYLHLANQGHIVKINGEKDFNLITEEIMKIIEGILNEKN